MYKVNEIFYSIQGEGARCGTAAVFVRFSGCNMKCRFCDTRHRDGKAMSAQDIAVQACYLMPLQTRVVLTGGEPCLQYDGKLWDTLCSAGVRSVALETNGSARPGAPYHWVCCSPKVGNETFARNFPEGVNEVKYVIGKGDPLPIVPVWAGHRFLSPVFAGRKPAPGALERCLELIRQDPRWRLTTQCHKYWGLR